MNPAPTASFLLFYNGRVFAEGQLDTPLALFEEGHWNWVNFTKLCTDVGSLMPGELYSFARPSEEDMTLVWATLHAHGARYFDKDGRCIMDSETTLRKSLVLFDSGRDMTEPHITNDGVPFGPDDGYDYIKPSQISWYEGEMAALRTQFPDVKSLLYMHIPIPEYKDIFKDEREEDGSYAPTGKAEVLYGVQYESVGSSPYNSGLFESMKRNGAQAIFAGHDHVNDWAAKLEGIYLVYTQAGGYNCYGMGAYNDTFFWDEKDWLQGSTLTTLKEDGSIALEQKKNSRFLK
jgi:hypothetical protein